MNSNSHVGYIKRQDTFSSDRKHCENSKGCHHIFFALSDIERLHLLALNLTEYDMSYINKSDECPPCVIERRFGLRLDYDKNRIDNFSEATSEHICGECREPFKVPDLGKLMAELKPEPDGVHDEKVHRVHALTKEGKGKGRCQGCAVEQIEKACNQCEMCATDLTKQRSLDSTTVTGLCFRELDIHFRDADRIAKKVHNMMHKDIDATCFHCSIFRIEKDQ